MTRRLVGLLLAALLWTMPASAQVTITPVSMPGGCMADDLPQFDGTKWTCVAASSIGGGVADPGSNGYMVRTALDTSAARTLTGTANQIAVTNGDGSVGNPVFSLPSALVAPGTAQVTSRLGVGHAVDGTIPAWVTLATSGATAPSAGTTLVLEAGATSNILQFLSPNGQDSQGIFFGNVGDNAGGQILYRDSVDSLTFVTGAANQWSMSAGALSGLATGGQTINGGTAANDDLTLQGTTHATKTTSYVLLQEDGGFVGLGTSAPTDYFNIAPNVSTGVAFRLNNADTGFTTSDGLFVGLTAGEDVYVWNYENTLIGFATNGSERGRFHASGCFSINNTVDCGAGNLSVTGTGAFSGALSSTTLNTGQGANELYPMDQAVLTTSNVKLSTLSVGSTLTALAPLGVRAAAGTTLGNSRHLILDNASGVTGQRIEIGIGYGGYATSTFQAVVLGHIITADSVSPMGDFYVALKSTDADVAPTERTRIVGSTGFYGIGTSAPDRLLHPELADAVTNAVSYVQRLSHITSGSATTGFGLGLEAELENASGTNRVAGSLAFVYTDATDATEDADAVFNLIRAGTLTEGMRVIGTGIIKPNAGYQSTDGTAGLTQTCAAAVTAVTVKNGLITAITCP